MPCNYSEWNKNWLNIERCISNQNIFADYWGEEFASPACAPAQRIFFVVGW